MYPELSRLLYADLMIGLFSQKVRDNTKALSMTLMPKDLIDIFQI